MTAQSPWWANLEMYPWGVTKIQKYLFWPSLALLSSSQLCQRPFRRFGFYINMSPWWSNLATNSLSVTEIAKYPFWPSFTLLSSFQLPQSPFFCVFVTKQSHPPGGQNLKQAISSLRLWLWTNPAKFCSKIPKTKTTCPRTTRTAVTPGGSYTEKGKALA